MQMEKIAEFLAKCSRQLLNINGQIEMSLNKVLYAKFWIMKAQLGI